MLNDDEYLKLRQDVIDNFDIYDLVELLGLTVEDVLDNTTEWEDNQTLRNRLYGSR